jgi:hypothetical protein
MRKARGRLVLLTAYGPRHHGTQAYKPVRHTGLQTCVPLRSPERRVIARISFVKERCA